MKISENACVTEHLIDMSILYCEDTALSRLKLSRILTQNVAELFVATDGLSGIELFKKHQPDLVISDIEMPGMDGLSMCQSIRQINPHVKIILLSVHDKTKHLYAAIDLAVDKYLKKPVDVSYLMKIIESIAVDVKKQKLLSSKLAIAQTLVHKELLENGDLNTRFNKIQRLGLIRHISYPKSDFSRDTYIVTHNKGSIYVLVANGAQGDEAGDSLASEMLTMQLPKIFKSQVKAGHSISATAKVLNKIMVEQFTGYLVAATLLRIDHDERLIEVLNCNNPPAYLIEKNGNKLCEFETSAFELGSINNEKKGFEIESFSYDGDAYLYVFTDGLLNTLHNHHIDSGIDGSYQWFINSKNKDTFEYIKHLLAASTLNGQDDDITLLEIPFLISSQSENIPIPPLEQLVSRNKLLSFYDANPSCLERYSILYIGENEEQQNTITEQLRGYLDSFYYASTRKDTLEKFSEHFPSVVIVEMDFIEMMESCFIDELQSFAHTAAIIILNSSGEIIGSPVNLPCFGKAQCVCPPVGIENISKAIKKELKKSSEQQHIDLSASIYLFSSLAMTITNRDKRIVSVNPSFCRITGYSQQEVIGRTPKILSSGKHDEAFYRMMWQSIDTKYSWSGEIWNKRKNGELFLEWISINAVTNDEGAVTHYFSVFADITERKAAEETIRKLTYQDQLTSLPNRRQFLESLKHEIKKSEKSRSLFAVLFIDIDHLKDINDTMGHECGDGVIKEVAKRLKACIGNTDIVSRFGSDEFTICLTGLKNIGNVETATQTILKAMAKPIKLDDELLYLSVSIGVAFYPDDADTISNLLKHADQAMFSAKYSGRNCVRYFDASMQEQAQLRKELIKDMRNAIGTEQFSIHYQPIVDLTNGTINKAEALLRWTSPIRGKVNPVEFIPIAEDTGMITQLGDWVFRQAVLQVKEWQAKYGKDFQISINKSPKQFQNEQENSNGWVNFINENEVKGNGIVIEITEGLLMDTNTANTRQLLIYKDAGIQVALDDFGTGYSSLAYLKKFDIDYIKIDRMFISNLSDSEANLALCEAIILMAHKLGLKVIAEGIETEQQLTLLSNAGCDYGQGYLFSKPVPRKEFEKFLENKS